ncbi:MAG: hypothetical protein QM820_63335 [Minicystis sp.]
MPSLLPRSCLALALAVPVTLAAVPARAQPYQPYQPNQPYQPYVAVPVPVQARPADTPEPPSTSLWYGWQTLIAVAPFDIAMFTGLARWHESYGPGTFAAGFVGRNLAPAIVHMAHRRPGVGFGSIGLHAVATATGVAVGYAIGIAIQANCPPRDPCRYGVREMPPGPEYGAIAGSMVGTVMDVVFLARRSRSAWGVTGSLPATPTVAFSPFATPSALGVAAGGTF